jgi:hypothetical protein
MTALAHRLEIKAAYPGRNTAMTLGLMSSKLIAINSPQHLL